MSIIRSLTALLVLVAGAPAVLAGGTTIETGTSPKVCNCTPGAIDLEVCHSSTVTTTSKAGLTVGIPSASFTAGWSSVEQTGQSTCAASTLPSGTCQFFEYTYVCTYETYWFSSFNSKTCTLDQTVFKQIPVDPADCRE